LQPPNKSNHEGHQEKIKTKESDYLNHEEKLNSKIISHRKDAKGLKDKKTSFLFFDSTFDVGR